MIIYSVTVNIEEEIHDRWVDWMRITHIPDVLKTGCFKEARFTRVMVQEEQGITYSIQYLCENEQVLNHYADTYAPALQKQHKDLFEGKFHAFRTMLKVVDVFVVDRQVLN